MNVLFDQEKLEIRAKEHKIPQFKVKQIFFELFKNQRIEWDEMTTLSNQLKDELKSEFSPISLKCMETVEAETTTKFAFQTEDGYTVEAIIMYHWQDEKYIKNGKRKLNRITLCISSQIGCPVNCLFCVTGKLWFTRNLTWDEIISQIMYANAYIFKRFGKKEDWTHRWVRNVVFMWMWEPLLNYDEVKKSVEIMLQQDRFSLGRRHVTISTAGIIPWIERLIEDKLDVKLAVSLHAPNQALRERIMPIARRYQLDELMEVIDRYVEVTDNRIFYEYIMISWITDKPELADELVELLRDRLAHINLIPYNANPVIDLKESSEKSIQNFKRILEKGWITVTVRESMWREAKWACGQLGYERVKDI